MAKVCGSKTGPQFNIRINDGGSIPLTEVSENACTKLSTRDDQTSVVVNSTSCGDNCLGTPSTSTPCRPLTPAVRPNCARSMTDSTTSAYLIRVKPGLSREVRGSSRPPLR